MVLKYQDSWWLSNKNKWSSSRLLQLWKKYDPLDERLKNAIVSIWARFIEFLSLSYLKRRSGNPSTLTYGFTKESERRIFLPPFSLSRVCHSDIKRWCHPSCLNDDLERKWLENCYVSISIFWTVFFYPFDINLESFWSIYHHINISFLVKAKCSS